MPSSPNYERLRKLAALASVESTDTTTLAEIQSTLTDLREAISHANAQFSQLTPKLNTPAETRALQEMAMVDFGEVYMSVFEHNKGVAEERNRQREQEALRILDEANDTLEGLLAELSDSPFTGAPDSPASGGPRHSAGPPHTPSTGGGPSSRTPGEPRCGTNPTPNPGAPGQTTRPTSPGMWGTPPGTPARDEQVTRINDDPPEVDPSHFTAGDTTTLTPAPPPEDDRW